MALPNSAHDLLCFISSKSASQFRFTRPRAAAHVADFTYEDLPMDSHHLRRLFDAYTTIAVVGLSNKKHRDSYATARYLQGRGYRIIPVTSRFEEILGERCYPNLRAIPERVDVVNCFVRPAGIPAITEEAIAIGARMLWMQLGIVHEEAAARAAAAGLEVMMDRCIMLEHQRLMAQ